MAYSSEFLLKIKELIKEKLIEIDAFGDEELPDYITVMVANKKKRSSMKKDLQLFLGDDAENFTEWLHNLVSSMSKEISKHESSKKSRSESSKKRSQSPKSSRKPSFDAEMDDVLNFQTEENEFIDELIENKPEPKPKEKRRVVATSSLKGDNKRKSSPEIPRIRSVVKDVNEKTDSRPPSSSKPSVPSAGGKLLKRAMNDVKGNATKTQDSAERNRAPKRKLDEKRDISLTEEPDPMDTDEAEVPAKVTKFVITMGDTTPTGIKPSVKSRLGPRVVTHNFEDTSQVTDARDILISRKLNNESSNASATMETTDVTAPDAKKTDRSSVPSSLQRCKYWPNCRNQEGCEFFHPKEECTAFPNCRYGSRCLFIHPPCRFGAQCSRPDCAYTHPPQHVVITAPPTPKVVCRYYPHCKMPPGTCPFLHPNVKPLCRFGAACLNRETTCNFIHPAAGPLPFISKLKWVAPGKSSTNPSEKSGVAADTSGTSLPEQSEAIST